MTANTQWLNFIENTIGAKHLFQFQEADTAFIDVIGGLSIGLTSGVATEQATGLIGNATDKSIHGSATVVCTKTGDLTLGGTDLNGPWSIGCFFRFSDPTPASGQHLWSAGDTAGTGRRDIGVYYTADAINLRNDSLPSAVPMISGVSAAGYLDGNWHLLIVQYDNSVNDNYRWSVDGGAFTQTAGTFDLSGTPTTRGITILTAIDGTLNGADIGLDELLVVDHELTDAQAALIYDRALTSGFPADGWTLTPGLGGGMGIN